MQIAESQLDFKKLLGSFLGRFSEMLDMTGNDFHYFLPA